MSGRAACALRSIVVTMAVGVVMGLGCGDRAPPALWPEPPPPTLAAPIGVDEDEGEGPRGAGRREGEMHPPAGVEPGEPDAKPRSKLPPSPAAPAEAEAKAEPEAKPEPTKPTTGVAGTSKGAPK